MNALKRYRLTQSLTDFFYPWSKITPRQIKVDQLFILDYQAANLIQQVFAINPGFIILWPVAKRSEIERIVGHVEVFDRAVQPQLCVYLQLLPDIKPGPAEV